MEPIRILHVLGILNMGGAESRIMELYRNIDRERVQFDFLVHLDKPSEEPITDSTPGSFADEIRSLGGRIYALPKYRVYNTSQYRKAVTKFFEKHNEFAMVQGHMTSTAGIYLPIAKEIYTAREIPLTTIAHARSAGVDKGLKGRITKYLRRNLSHEADYLFACSKEAGEAVFGENAVMSGAVRFIPNAVDTARFAYDEETRDAVRRELSIGPEEFVIGHVGRFSFMKNHTYLLRIFREVYAQNRNARLLLIGGGELFEEIKSQAADLSDRVIFAGKKKHIERYYQAMDAFVFPSIFEGLPGSVVEAACAGLPCYVSDTVTREVKVTEQVSFLSADSDPKVWADLVLKGAENARVSSAEEVKAAGFDVKNQVALMTDFYEGSSTLSEQCYEGMRVLHIVGAMYPGGMENFILNLYKNVDRTKMQFDIAVHTRKENDYCDLITSMGGRIYELPRMSRHPIQNYRAIRKLVKENHYRIVVRHTANAMIVPQLWAAKRGGAMTVCHSHNETDPMKLAHRIGRLFLKKAADVKMACSEKAGYWMYGKHAEFSVIHNAIDIDAFRFAEEKRKAIRAEFGISDTQRVYGNIANFIASKNHDFLLEIYAEILKKDPQAIFFCIGEGDLRPAIEAKREALELTDRVILTGIRKDVESLMSALDVLVFPSFFEGLPLTLIEAQAAGLPILMSDSVTKDVIVTDGIVTPFSLAQGAEKWAEMAMAMQSKDRSPQRSQIARYGYDIKNLAEQYRMQLCELLRQQ